MKKIFIKIAANIYKDGIPVGKGYSEDSYKPIANQMIEVMFEPGMIDYSTHLISIGVVGRILGTRTFSFAGICEQSQLGDILIPSSGLAISVAKMMKDYYEHFKRPYNAPVVDRFVKKILDDITNNIPLKSLFMDIKVRSPQLYRQMSLEYKSRFGYNIEIRLNDLVNDQETYTFSNLRDIIRHAEFNDKGGINYRNLISNMVEARRLTAAQAPDPAPGARPTPGPITKENVVDQFPEYKQSQYVAMNFDRRDLLAKKFKPQDLDEKQLYTTKQLKDNSMTFRDKIFVVTKKLPNGYYTVAGLDESGKTKLINIWGAFLKDATARVAKKKGLSDLDENQRGRFLNNLGIEDNPNKKSGDTSKDKSALLQETAADLGMDYFDFIAYLKDAQQKKVMKSFKQYEKAAASPSWIGKQMKWFNKQVKKIPGAKATEKAVGKAGDFAEKAKNKLTGQDPDVKTEKIRLKLQMKQALDDKVRSLMIDDFSKYSEKYSTNTAIRAKQVGLDPEEYKKKLQLAGRNGMSITNYLKKAEGLVASDDRLNAYIEDPYSMLASMGEINEMVKSNPDVAKNKKFMDVYNSISGDESHKIEVFLKHFQLPPIESLESNNQEALKRYPEIEAALEEFDEQSNGNHAATVEALMPRLHSYVANNYDYARAYQILEKSGIDPNIFHEDEGLAEKAIAANENKLPNLKQQFENEGLKDQALKLDEIIKKSKIRNPSGAGAAGYDNITLATNPDAAPPAGQPAVAPAPQGS